MVIGIDLNDVLRDYTSQFASYYKKVVDPDFDIDNMDFFTDNFRYLFPFESDKAYQDFVYEDCAYELYGCASPCDKALPARFNNWLQNDLANMDFEKPRVMLVSPFEFGLTIQGTHFFLSKNAYRAREIYFPKDSQDIWNRCDIVVTASAKLLSKRPNDPKKIGIKIKNKVNESGEAEYNFDSMLQLLSDTENGMEKIITDWHNKFEADTEQELFGPDCKEEEEKKGE